MTGETYPYGRAVDLVKNGDDCETGARCGATPGAVAVGERGSISGLSAVETAPIGNRFVLRNGRSGAVLLTNETGKRALEGLRDGLGPADIAAELEVPEEAIGLMIASWTEAGLFAARTARDAVAHATAAPRPYSAHFGLGARTFILRSSTPEVFGEVATLMAEYRRAPCEPCPEVTVTCGEAGYQVHLDGAPLWRPASADEARFLVLQAAQRLLLGPRVTAVAHGGLAVRGEEGVLFVGDSGVGKTTLVRALVSEGWGYGGDDLVALLDDGTHAAPLPLAANVKVFGGSASARGRMACWLSRRGGLHFPEPVARPGVPVRVSAVVFPRYTPGCGFDTAPVEPGEALQRLLRSGTEIVGAAGSIAPLAMLLSRVPCFDWKYGHTDAAIHAADALFGSVGTGNAA